MEQNNFFKENKTLFVLTAFAVFILVILYSTPNSKEQIKVQVEPVIQRPIPDYNLTINTIEAKSFYVYDLVDKQPIFSRDEHAKLPLASITKLMSGFVALDVMPNPTIVTITHDDIATEGDSGLVVDEKWNLKDLLDFSLMTSSNDGMHAIASTLNYYAAVNNKDIVKIMNERANNFGMKDTVFVNETGLDVDDNMAGSYSSAYDVAILMSKIIENNPALISCTNKTTEDFISLSKITHTAYNTNTSIDQLPGLLASKTGFTNLAGGNLAVIFDAGFMHPVVIVVLGSTSEGRFSDVIKLQKITLEKLSE